MAPRHRISTSKKISMCQKNGPAGSLFLFCCLFVCNKKSPTQLEIVVRDMKSRHATAMRARTNDAHMNKWRWQNWFRFPLKAIFCPWASFTIYPRVRHLSSSSDYACACGVSGFPISFTISNPTNQERAFVMSVNDLGAARTTPQK